MARLKYWVWLSCVQGVRPEAKYDLLGALGGPERIFFASREELLSAYPLRPAEVDRLMDKSMDPAARAVSFCGEHGISILTLQDATYPERLRNISDPPVVLYVWGKLPPLDETMTLAVVGTRKATPYGVKMASLLGRELGAGGAIVVSGLAEGCDCLAMEAALRAGGLTVGVLGTAIEQVYPSKNRRLFDAVRGQGCLLSEYPPRARTFPYNFKMRNRIITGLSLGVVVVESPLHSGTQNTAGHALAQNRDVFAVPGNADAAASAGCNALIAQGAVPVTSGEEVLSSYSGRVGLQCLKAPSASAAKEIDKQKDIVYIDLTERRKNAPSNKLSEDALRSLPPVQQQVLRVMTGRDMHTDDIIAAAGLSARETLAALTMLQVTGYVTQGRGQRYTRVK